jgi:hypothetical protein
LAYVTLVSVKPIEPGNDRVAPVTPCRPASRGAPETSRPAEEPRKTSPSAQESRKSSRPPEEPRKTPRPAQESRKTSRPPGESRKTSRPAPGVTEDAPASSGVTEDVPAARGVMEDAPGRPTNRASRPRPVEQAAEDHPAQPRNRDSRAGRGRASDHSTRLRSRSDALIHRTRQTADRKATDDQLGSSLGVCEWSLPADRWRTTGCLTATRSRPWMTPRLSEHEGAHLEPGVWIPPSPTGLQAFT